EEKPSTGTETKPEVNPTTYMAKIEQVSDKGNPIQGVKYKITYKDGTTEVVTVNGTELDLNNKGKAIDSIDVYEAPRGYIATNSETSTVTKDNTVTTIGKFTFKEVYSEYKNIINQKTKDGKAITGVEYKVTYKDGTTEIVKDNQPSLTLKDKQVEDITVAKTPAGYRLADTSRNEVNLSNNVVKLEYDFTFDRLNEAPSITGTNVTINQGSKFNTEMLNLKAKDDNDGDITKNIKVVKNDVNTQKPGTYNVTVQVTDSDGLTTSKTFTVTVKKVEEKRSWTYMPELSKQTFDALNAYRKANGLEPLEYSEKSAERAKARAEYNAEHNTADHTASQIGLYSNDGNAQSFIDSWAKSPLHKEDMLTKTYTGAGAGVYKDSEGRYFAVVDFYNDFWD
ncbi:CAP domain-containing protein, partial [Clostridium baratii]